MGEASDLLEPQLRVFCFTLALQVLSSLTVRVLNGQMRGVGGTVSHLFSLLFGYLKISEICSAGGMLLMAIIASF